MITIQQLSAEDWRHWRAVRLLALADAPQAFGSRLEDWQGVGDTEPRWRQRLDVVPYNLIAYHHGDPLGQASGSAPRPDRWVELTSMWVAPGLRRQGVGGLLVGAVMEWARSNDAGLELAVKTDNARAIAFYRRLGFTDHGPSPEDDTEQLMRNPLGPETPAVV